MGFYLFFPRNMCKELQRSKLNRMRVLDREDMKQQQGYFLDKAETMRIYINSSIISWDCAKKKRMFIQFHHETRGNSLDVSGYEHNREGTNEQECSNQTGLQPWRFQQRMI